MLIADNVFLRSVETMASNDVVVKIEYAYAAVVHKAIAVVAVLGNGATADVYARYSIYVHNFANVEMSVQHNVAFLQMRYIVFVVNVSVRQKNSSALIKQYVFRKKIEVAYHCVHFAVAVSTDNQQLVGNGVENLRHFHRGVLLRKVIAGAVIVHIAQQHHHVRTALFELFRRFFRPIGRTVNVAYNKQFHLSSSTGSVGADV